MSAVLKPKVVVNPQLNSPSVKPRTEFNLLWRDEENKLQTYRGEYMDAELEELEGEFDMLHIRLKRTVSR